MYRNDSHWLGLAFTSAIWMLEVAIERLTVVQRDLFTESFSTAELRISIPGAETGEGGGDYERDTHGALR